MGVRFTYDEEFTRCIIRSVCSVPFQTKLRQLPVCQRYAYLPGGCRRRPTHDLRKLDGIEVSAARSEDDRADIHNPIPMIVSGYLTIKKFDERFRIYTLLGFPNEEVEYGFLNFCCSFYTSVSERIRLYIGKFVHELEIGDINAFLKPHGGFLLLISFCDSTRRQKRHCRGFHLYL